MFSSFVPVRMKAKVHIALHPARHPAPARPHRRQQLVIDQRQAAQVRVRERQGHRLLHAHRATFFCHSARTDAAAAFSVNLVVIYHHDKNDTCLRCRAVARRWPSRVSSSVASLPTHGLCSMLFRRLNTYPQ